MNTLDYYTSKYNIDIAKAEKRRLVQTENGTRTQLKEMLGEEIIKRYHLFDTLFPNNIGYKKVTNRKLQLAGADYEVYIEGQNDPVYIDLKSTVGPNYSMNEEDFDEVEPTEDLKIRKAAALEVYQNKIFTNNAGKITDYFLYIICDDSGVYFSLLSFNSVRNTCLKHKDDYIIKDGVGHLKQHYPFKRYISNNGTGVYIKYPVITTQLERRIVD